MTHNRLVLGSLEVVSIPTLGVENILAKVDTGAFSGALHCSDIEVFTENGTQWLHFTPLGNDTLKTKTSDFKSVIVRSASGHESARYTIPVQVQINGTAFETTIGLSDRTLMKREMLLGRRFLLEHDILVDVRLTKDIDDEAERIED